MLLFEELGEVVPACILTTQAAEAEELPTNTQDQPEYVVIFRQAREK